MISFRNIQRLSRLSFETHSNKSIAILDRILLRSSTSTSKRLEFTSFPYLRRAYSSELEFLRICLGYVRKECQSLGTCSIDIHKVDVYVDVGVGQHPATPSTGSLHKFRIVRRKYGGPEESISTFN